MQWCQERFLLYFSGILKSKIGQFLLKYVVSANFNFLVVPVTHNFYIWHIIKINRFLFLLIKDYQFNALRRDDISYLSTILKPRNELIELFYQVLSPAELHEG